MHRDGVCGALSLRILIGMSQHVRVCHPVRIVLIHSLTRSLARHPMPMQSVPLAVNAQSKDAKPNHCACRTTFTREPTHTPTCVRLQLLYTHALWCCPYVLLSCMRVCACFSSSFWWSFRVKVDSAERRWDLHSRVQYSKVPQSLSPTHTTGERKQTRRKENTNRRRHST